MSSGSTTTALVAAATAFVVVLAVAACAVAVIAPLRRKLFPPRERGAVAAGHTDHAAAGLFLEASTDGEMCIVRDGKQPWPQALWGRSRAALVEDGASILQRRLPDIDVSTAAFSEVFSSAIAASSTGTAHIQAAAGYDFTN
ncbi:hypothetical protein DFJ73DRAFT_778142 [Zopfochytrium polystomum]|nr:hypothetical protein DFJ73DRAFT_778142 [Zopfochytrium polystomum]